MTLPCLTVSEFAAERDKKSTCILVDVREPDEHACQAIEGSVLIPLGQLPNRVDELPRDCPIVVHCQKGGRSAKAVQYLLGQGFSDVRNLTGGIEAWLSRG